VTCKETLATILKSSALEHIDKGNQGWPANQDLPPKQPFKWEIARKVGKPRRYYFLRWLFISCLVCVPKNFSNTVHESSPKLVVSFQNYKCMDANTCKQAII